jgi:acyl-coenzyme A synthetase/AMP-(fatty) acid ligase
MGLASSPAGDLSASTRLPLVGHRDLDRPVAWRSGVAVRASGFIADAQRLAAQLPPTPFVVNLCEDRYRFAVAFAAVLLAGKTNLFPASRHDQALARIVAAYPDCGAISDSPVPALGVPTVEYPELPPAHSSRNPTIAAEHPAAIVFTSGSTGAPRPNLKPWGALVASALAERSALGLSATGDFSLVATVPPQHMYGFESSVLLALAGGGALHPARPLFLRDVQTALEALPAPRVLVTTPVHIRACVEADIALPPLELLLSAAAPLAPSLAAAAERCFSTRVMEIYGFTEAGQVASRRTTLGPAWRLLPGVSLVATDDGWAVEGGPVPGRVPVSDVLRPLGAGEFALEGRASDLIDVAGKRASLADLNRALGEIPGVQDGAFHLPRELNGAVTRLMAFVVAPERSRQDILDALRASVDPAFLPRPLLIVDHLPRAATGKLPLEALQALERLAREGEPDGG